MSSPASPTVDRSSPRGLTIEQQREIAAAQAAAAAASTNSQTSASNQQLVSTSLYVGELDQNVQEAQLFHIFSQVSTVESLRICRDSITRRSLGYAYVNFKTKVDGERALQALNFSLINGKPCRIMWSQRDPAKRKTSTGNVFVKNLDLTVTHKALHDTFAQYGSILSSKIAVDDQGNSKGYGFVHFETEEAAENAIQNLNGMSLYGKELYVGHHIPKRERQPFVEETKQKFTNVYVKNLVLDIGEEELRSLFIEFGPIDSVLIQKDEFGVSKGFGFINYQRCDDAERAVQEMHDKEYFGKRLFVSRAQKKSEREDELRKQYEQARLDKLSKYQGVNLYIKNLSDDIDDERLRDEFLRYGMITSAKIMKDEKTGLSKGFGFVCFSSADEATKAVAEMNGRMLGSKPIYVALAQRKEERRSQLEAQMTQRNMNIQQAFAPVPVNNHPAAPMFAPPTMAQPRPPRWSQAKPAANQGSAYPAYTSPVPNRPVYPTEARPSGSAARSEVRPSTSPNIPVAQHEPRPEEKQLTLAMVEALSPADQKQMLGERIFRVVYANHPKVAGKVTGMLLEMDKEELVYLINRRHLLESKAREGVAALEQAQMAKGTYN
ncbi:Protein phosphatase PP2A regulatory subunit B [Apophysomyces sp. BC1034]|nr:Protein phosphatase PP2A regulatory subunit B [Apophysomyces sp. BC1015]KAG0181623.1 Protein phosphatase PP2A regulatory subunit B [Apophysomyces sp. BC1021]KAG0192220.1 Protein phosphatase PP2A regulatory subunit B [Apophysomyces sp. BC1034]